VSVTYYTDKQTNGYLYPQVFNCYKYFSKTLFTAFTLEDNLFLVLLRLSTKKESKQEKNSYFVEVIFSKF